MGELKPSVLVAGAGIIGIASACTLASRGHQVRVVDRLGICEGTSSGNAGAFAFSDLLPLAQKGVLTKIPKWLADPLGPLSIPPAYFPKLLPWFGHFLRASQVKNRERSITAQASLMALAREEWYALMQRSGTSGMRRAEGSLELYETEQGFRASLPGWDVRVRNGISFEHVSGARLAELQPGLDKRFRRGTFVPGWETVDDPKLLGEVLWKYAESLGAVFEQAEVAGLSTGQTYANLHLADGRTLTADKVVICAGAWSHQLARQLGDRIPLETERGYNSTLPLSALDLKRQLIFSEHGFVMTPLSIGIRIGGAVELGGLERGPDYRRSEAMLTKAKTFLPDLDISGGRQWMGYRPSLPDSLPVIDYASRSRAVIYAFGHGHLGLTQAAATAKLVSELATNQVAGIDLSPFSATRF
ncbi:NAD(P)/FAD-dependent oxidoreductase [Limoniibacter endophyticus]|uniref:D-amino-acid dehydrogenase n=1 Tax=Limoniibacter endophyticus TaxID=1565040 RepID=A0A8J3GHP6_9HYPH|nr:FAD-binding oxidoreductase [Limoniibacter endophyticus]GHC73561.1 D-amino-acid dehydrogenase [Limoniibacter endophyticus]